MYQRYIMSIIPNNQEYNILASLHLNNIKCNTLLKWDIDNRTAIIQHINYQRHTIVNNTQISFIVRKLRYPVLREKIRSADVRNPCWKIVIILT